ncbi:MAG: lytic transglycosylase [Deltaproteobacteria bacterium]|nr:MAG: lytic transglycosylase [Deltaproteobacteria bacterium]
MNNILCHFRCPPLLPTVFAALLILVTPFLEYAAASQSFPSPAAIQANVQFWEKIYADYSIHSAVIHDRKDLSRIYGVVSLIDKKIPGAQQLNKALIRIREKKYRTILHNLAAGKRPQNAEEKKIAAMFTGKKRAAQMKEAATRLRTQTGLKERFIEGVIRSGAYMPQLKRIFITQGLPAELAYLPHVESSFSPQAHSKSGAAGIWQFTRATGKQYLRISSAIDERLDPFLSAKAAAAYLKNSYNKLGNWPMAITAYNYGTAGMIRAKKKLGSYERIFRFYDTGHFGFASRNFYAEYLAALHVAQRLERTALPCDKPISFTTLQLPGYISIASLQRHFNITTQTLRRFNPALKEAIFQGKKLVPKDYQLRLPNTPALTRQKRKIPRSYLHSRQIPDKYYRVQRGDTASEIAEKYHISLKQLRNANNLDRNAAIFIGQRLRIPQRSLRKNNTKTPPLTKQKKQFRQQRQIPILSDNKKKTPQFTLVNSEKKKRPTRH